MYGNGKKTQFLCEKVSAEFRTIYSRHPLHEIDIKP